MKCCKHKFTKAIALVLCMLPISVDGQKLVRFSPPSNLCAGTADTVRFGFNLDFDVVVRLAETTLGHSERIFLPDGTRCGDPPSCAYRSPVTFSCFREGDLVESMTDILYVRLNIEHSFIGDIYIGITCPNGQRSSLLKYSNQGSSDCTASIPTNHRGWTTGSNTGYGSYLGLAYDDEGNTTCDSSVFGNEPGTGWNYCWSNHSSYSYAPGDALIYRSASTHAVSHSTFAGRHDVVDSSNVIAGTNFYHPDESFASLVGCPLNGEWTIEVQDGWQGDNGYIFEWDIALNADRITEQECHVESYALIGKWVEAFNDSTFVIKAPSSLSSDTSLSYRFRIVTTCGDTIDTTAVVNFHPAMRIVDTIAVCKEYTLDFHRITADTTMADVATSAAGCDSSNILYIDILAPNLKAVINASPLMVTPEHPDIYLHDESRHSIDRLWILDDKESHQQHLVYTFPKNLDTLPVTLIAFSEEGCADTAILDIAMDRSSVFIPNVFTPDEPTNRVWYPATQDLSELYIWIYNRQGLLVRHLEGLDAQWDGTADDGAPCPQASYVYTLLYRTLAAPERLQKMKGTILLLR